jgi:hypothetical protein
LAVIEKDSIKQWVDDFAESIIQQTEALRQNDYRIGNVHARRGAAAFSKLRAIGDMGRDALIPLLRHERADVRVGTAACLLRHRTQESLAVLRTEAATGQGLASFEASEAIQRWEEGDWHLDPE